MSVLATQPGGEGVVADGPAEFIETEIDTRLDLPFSDDVLAGGAVDWPEGEAAALDQMPGVEAEPDRLLDAAANLGQVATPEVAELEEFDIVAEIKARTGRTLTDQQINLLATMINNLPAEEWFQRKDVGYIEAEYVSKGAFDQAYHKLIKVLEAAGVVEHNGKDKSQSKHRFIKAYEPPALKVQEPVRRKTPDTKPPAPPASASPKAATKAPKLAGQTGVREWEAKRMEDIRRRALEREDGRSKKEKRKEQTLQERLQDYLNGEADFPTGLSLENRQAVRVFLGESAVQKEEIPGYHNRHRRLQVWLNPQLAFVIDPTTGNVNKPRN